MNKVLVSSLALLSALAVFEAAKADEAPAKPKRERARRAGAGRSGPAAGQQLVGRAGRWLQRRQLREQRLRRAGRLCLPVRQQHRQQLLRDPVFVQRAQGRLHHRPVRRLPRPVGELGRRYRRRLVLQEQRDLFEPVLAGGDCRHRQQLCANRPVLRLRQAEIGFLDPGARWHARHALEPAVRDGWRRVRRNQRRRSRIPEASTSARAAPRAPPA